MMKGKMAVFSVFLLLLSVLSFFHPSNALAAPNFQMPFPCGQTWSGQTRTNHSPLYSVDLNRSYDYGDTVVASASGTVTRAENLGNVSYGKWVEIDHGNGWRTRYAHLSTYNVSVGQHVSAGQKIGEVGGTGDATGPHLHYEQRYNGNDVKISWNGSRIYYFGTRSYTSHNSCNGVKGTVNTKTGVDLNVRSGPSTNYSIVGQVSDGQTVTISCQTPGESITGTYGTSSIWDKIGPGEYISDAYVYTGSDGYVTGRCN